MLTIWRESEKNERKEREGERIQWKCIKIIYHWVKKACLSPETPNDNNNNNNNFPFLSSLLRFCAIRFFFFLFYYSQSQSSYGTDKDTMIVWLICAFATALVAVVNVAAVDCECCFEIIFVPQICPVGIPWQFTFANVYKKKYAKWREKK